MFTVETVTKQAQKLIDVTREARQIGINAVRPGAHF
jgi:methionine aminopeptidase